MEFFLASDEGYGDSFLLVTKNLSKVTRFPFVDRQTIQTCGATKQTLSGSRLF